MCVSLKCSGIRVLLLLASLLLISHSQCSAAEAGLPNYWPGFRNYLGGVVPHKPGFYFRNDIIFYSASAPRVVLNGLPIENISADLAADLIEPLYVLPRKLFGATHAVVVTQPLIWANLNGRIIGTDIEPSGSRINIGDTIVSPLFLGWNKGKLHYNTNIAISIPTGPYNIHRVVNTGRNYWTVDPEFGITYLDPGTGWDFSGILGCTFNTENPSTKYKSGSLLHLDYAVAKMLKNGVKPGIVGYAEWQITPDSGEGAIFGSFESRVFALGPAVQWQAADNALLMFRYFHEFGARDHLEGDQYAISLKMSF